MSSKIHLELRFDGGCKPTNPGPRYGSYLLLKPAGPSDSAPQEIARESCFDLGHGTNNEAEWLACLTGLDRLISEAIKRRRDLKRIHVKIVTDSTVVAVRLQAEPKAVRPRPGPQCRMWVLAQHAWRRLDLLGGHTAEWRGRDGNVVDFGH